MKSGGKPLGLALLVAASLGVALHASSHREAPGITKTPKLDGTDFYMFRSYEAGRSGMVTLLANYLPLQDVYGGPNFFTLDPDGLYEIHIDNNGDAREDITFQFRFRTTRKNISLNIGGKTVACRSSTSAASGRMSMTPRPSTSSRATRSRSCAATVARDAGAGSVMPTRAPRGSPSRWIG